ncbi:hypothetical protein DYB25_006290 [Aphanomyces astaci]|uniref:Spondin-like TSP1 domain-containing protein n=1 Tax=Aphanomyces astaci TaxID=112090 RepID=A0A397BP23_APHAT|nr:hypothetical protein DYB25_006290 [Aphanomyces astaci]RHY88708.1 hypothetical protein DYB31_014585 [Aphanomyces astaci]
MRLSLSLSIIYAANAAQALNYDPKSVLGVNDPVLIAKIEGYMPPICSSLYGDAQHWTDWSICSAKCGKGEQVRFLTNDAKKNLQSNGCEISIDKRECNGNECPQDCQYSDWPSQWSTCDKATGIQVQSREEITPVKNGGKTCAELWGGVTRTRQCDVDCEGSFGEWSECQGKSGSRSRVFNKTVQALNGGKKCPAPVETERCNPECQAIAWAPFSECNPVTGLHTRTRDIPLDSNFIQLKSALKANNCPLTDTQPCDLDCKVSEWNDNGTCDLSTGTRKLTRHVVQKAVNCGKPCNSLDHDTNLESTETCPVHCQLSDWGPYFCDKVSGVSTSTRTIVRQPLNGGNTCGDLQRTKDCGPSTCETGDWNTQECSYDTCTAVRTREQLYPKRDQGKPCNLYDKTPCTLDAQMSEWSEWSTCDATGHKKRSREILNSACHGGAPAGHTHEKTTDGCGNIICDSVNNPWPSNEDGDVWGPCDQVSGIQTRHRAIITKPTDGTVCETQQSRTCAVNCALDAWRPWSKCNECTGLQNRTRSVLQPDLNGGNKCGDTKEVRNCDVVCEATEWTTWSEPDDSCTCTRTRTELSPALNGGQCVLEDTDKHCPRSCEVSEWSAPGECHTEGKHAGLRQFKRTVLKKPCNAGAACPELEKWETCNVDCEVGDLTDWGKCNLKTQLQERHRPVLQQPYNEGKQCGATTEVRACGTCSDLVGPFKYTKCDKETGTRTGVASWIAEPKQGQECHLQVTEPCDVSCDVSEWNAGTCDVHTAQQVFTRQIVVDAKNGGVACPLADELVRHEPCKVDCVASDLWGPWSKCNGQGFSSRKKIVDIVAQNGGSNADCLVEEVKVCAVDCAIDTDTGDVLQPALNGGKSCKKIAAENNLPGDYSDVTTTTNFMAMVSANKEYAMAALATGGVGLMFVAGLISTRRQRRGGYDSISRQIPN